MRDLNRLRWIVTTGALVLALVHIIWPWLAVDAITVGFLVIAVLPWLAPLIKSLELPGGLKIELQDMQEVTEKAMDAGLLNPAESMSTVDFSFQHIADRDPNLALAGLRIEIERRLRALYEKNGLQVRSQGLGQLLRVLDEHGIITGQQRSALNDIAGLLNSAVHGATVDPRAAIQAMEIAPALLESLTRLIEPGGPKVFVQQDPPEFALEGDLWAVPKVD